MAPSESRLIRLDRRRSGRVYLDENISLEVALDLRRLGVDVIAAREVQSANRRIMDYQQILIATRLERMIVTHNENDFRELHRALHDWSREWGVDRDVLHSGMALFPQRALEKKRVTSAEMANHLNDLLISEPVSINRLFTWSERDGWQEYPKWSRV